MVSFPGLGLSFNISEVAFNIFGINIYWYAICIVVGMVLSVILCSKDKYNFGINFEFVFENLIFAIIFGIIGARLYYVLFNLKYYLSNPIKILNLRDGGLAIYGGLIAGALVILKRCKKFKVNSLDLFDYIIPFVALAQSIGRWGNFFNVEAYGTQTSNFIRMGINTVNGYEEVHPAFLYESICTFIIYLFLRLMQKNRRFKGEIFYLYLFLYSGIRMIIESVRIDSLMFSNFRISQILSVAIFVFSGIMLLKKYVKYIYKKLHKLK